MTTLPLLRVLAGERLDPPPVWMMRQAGRYLPEYRELRAAKGGFLALATDPQAAAEVTLQPLRRFAMDGAILFSDILTVPWALGQDLWFEAGEGPRLAPPLDAGRLDALSPDHGRLEPVYAAVQACVAGLAREGHRAAMLGFAGSPWTVATYMVAGQGSKDQAAARSLAWREPERFARLIDAIVDLTAEYLLRQIAAGAQAVQLFDSWAGSLSPAQFDRWVVAPNRAIVERVHDGAPGVPVIGFPKGAGAKLLRYAREVGADAIGLDETLDCDWAHEQLPRLLPVQGNLDPMLLLAGGEALDAEVARIRRALGHRPHIFNLGHGISQHTPVAHVERMLAAVRTPLAGA